MILNKTEAPAPRDWAGAGAEASCVRLGFRKGNLTKVKRAAFTTIKCISPRMHSSFLNRRLILSVSYRMQFQLGDIGRKVQTWRIGSLGANWGTSQHPAARLFHRIHSFSTHSYSSSARSESCRSLQECDSNPHTMTKKKILELFNIKTTPPLYLRSVGTTSSSMEFLSAIDRETQTFVRQ